MAATMAFSDDARQAQDINNRRIEQRMYVAGEPFHPNESRTTHWAVLDRPPRIRYPV